MGHKFHKILVILIIEIFLFNQFSWAFFLGNDTQVNMDVQRPSDAGSVVSPEGFSVGIVGDSNLGTGSDNVLPAYFEPQSDGNWKVSLPVGVGTEEEAEIQITIDPNSIDQTDSGKWFIKSITMPDGTRMESVFIDNNTKNITDAIIYSLSELNPTIISGGSIVSSPEIVRIQQELQNNGYYSGPLDGKPTEILQNACLRYQLDNLGTLDNADNVSEPVWYWITRENGNSFYIPSEVLLNPRCRQVPEMLLTRVLNFGMSAEWVNCNPVQGNEFITQGETSTPVQFETYMPTWMADTYMFLNQHNLPVDGRIYFEVQNEDGSVEDVALSLDFNNVITRVDTNSRGESLIWLYVYDKDGYNSYQENWEYLKYDVARNKLILTRDKSLTNGITASPSGEELALTDSVGLIKQIAAKEVTPPLEPSNGLDLLCLSQEDLIQILENRLALIDSNPWGYSRDSRAFSDLRTVVEAQLRDARDNGELDGSMGGPYADQSMQDVCGYYFDDGLKVLLNIDREAHSLLNTIEELRQELGTKDDPLNPANSSATFEKLNQALDRYGELSEAKWTEILAQGYLDMITQAMDVYSKGGGSNPDAFYKAITIKGHLACVTDFFKNSDFASGLEAMKDDELNQALGFIDPETGFCPELARVSQSLTKTAAVATFWREAFKFAAFSVISAGVGSVLGGILRATGAIASIAEKAKAGVRWAKTLRTVGAVGKFAVGIGNQFDELSELAISLAGLAYDNLGGKLILSLFTGRPGALIAGSTNFLLRMAINSLVVGSANAVLVEAPDNNIAQFMSNPVGYILPITNQLGNLSDVCEFLHLFINAALRKPAGMHAFNITTTAPVVMPKTTWQSISTVLSSAGLTDTSLGIVPSFWPWLRQQEQATPASAITQPTDATTTTTSATETTVPVVTSTATASEAVTVTQQAATEEALASIFLSLPQEYQIYNADNSLLSASQMLTAIDRYLKDLISPFSSYRDGLLERMINDNGDKLTTVDIKQTFACLREVYTNIKSLQSLSDTQLRQYYADSANDEFKCLALACEVLRRVSDQESGGQKIIKLHPEQVLASYFASPSQGGRIIDFKTGEGKTECEFVTSVLTVKVSGLKAICITHNEPLKTQTIERLRGYYNFLGIKMGELNGMTSEADVLGKDVLWSEWSQPVYFYEHGGLTADILKQYFMIIDEADAVLIEQASSPCVLAMGSGEKLLSIYAEPLLAAAWAVKDNTITNIESACTWASSNQKRFAVYDLAKLNEIAINALLAKNYRNKVHYFISTDGTKLTLIEHISGDAAESKQFMGGMHQAVEAKEIADGNLKVGISKESVITVAYTLKSLVDKLAGFTAFSATAKLWANEFQELWGKEVLCVPSSTESRRIDNEILCKDKAIKVNVIKDLLAEAKRLNRPVALVCSDMERLANLLDELKAAGVPSEDLRYFTPVELMEMKEGGLEELKRLVGEAGAVTFATMVFGRGIDVKPESPLRVIMVDYQPDYVRDQVSGRAARQGAEGDSYWVFSADERGLSISPNFQGDYISCRRQGGGAFSSWQTAEGIEVQAELISAIEEEIAQRDAAKKTDGKGRVLSTTEQYSYNDIAVDVVLEKIAKVNSEGVIGYIREIRPLAEGTPADLLLQRIITAYESGNSGFRNYIDTNFKLWYVTTTLNNLVQATAKSPGEWRERILEFRADLTSRFPALDISTIDDRMITALAVNSTVFDGLNSRMREIISELNRLAPGF